MAFSKCDLILVVVLVVSGSINTLSTNWSNNIVSKGSDGNEKLFNHPFLQAAAMFAGETLCLLVFKIISIYTTHPTTNSIIAGNSNFNKVILLPAAMFDMFGTALMYIGLTFTYPSSFQMFRSAIILNVAVLSYIFLEKQLLKQEWWGIFMIMVGLTVVGLTDFLFASSPNETKGHNSLITGDMLIIIAQMISACQMVYEEKYVSGLNIPPLQAVGWEGLFGFHILSALLVIFYWIPAPPHFGHGPHGTIEDAIDGLIQIGNNPVLLCSILGTIISIAFFNFAGVSITKKMSASHRMVLDSVRTVVIWIVSIAAKWQKFYWAHLIGFTILIFGMCEYNGLFTKREEREIAETDDERNLLNDADVVVE